MFFPRASGLHKPFFRIDITMILFFKVYIALKTVCALSSIGYFETAASFNVTEKKKHIEHQSLSSRRSYSEVVRSFAFVPGLLFFAQSKSSVFLYDYLCTSCVCACMRGRGDLTNRRCSLCRACCAFFPRGMFFTPLSLPVSLCSASLRMSATRKFDLRR